jgi:chromosomal replication initiator protein
MTPRERVLKTAAEVSAEYYVSVDEMMSPDRINDDVCAARWHTWHRLREEQEYSLTQIARMFGRDHTTIMHGLRRYAAAGPDGVRRARAA